MSKLFRRLFCDDRGTSTVEYGLVAALVAIAVIGTLSTLGDKLQQTVATVQDQLSPAPR